MPDMELKRMEPIYLTPEGIQRLKDKLARLKLALPDMAAEAARTAAYGDRSENAAYKEAKSALRRANRQIWTIEEQLKWVQPIGAGRNAAGTVQIGSTVVLAFALAKHEEKKTFRILGPRETDPTRGRISQESPLGAALMGQKEGAIVTLQTANGERAYRIIEIR